MGKIVCLTMILVLMCCLSACDNNTNTEISNNEISNSEISNNEISNNEISNNEISNNEISNNENTNISNNTLEIQEDVEIVMNENGKYETPEGKEYSYCLTLSGTMPSAEKSSTWVVYTNDKNLTFEKASKSLYSSNSNDGVDMYIVS